MLHSARLILSRVPREISRCALLLLDRLDSKRTAGVSRHPLPTAFFAAVRRRLQSWPLLRCGAAPSLGAALHYQFVSPGLPFNIFFR